MGKVEAIVEGTRWAVSKALKNALIVFVAMSVALVMLGAIKREASENTYRWSVQEFVEDMKNVFEDFPIPDSALDYLAFTGHVFGWVITFWARFLNAGWIIDNDGFDGSVGAEPITVPLNIAEVQP